MHSINFKVIAHIKSDFPKKFGIPRQSGILKNLRSTIQFTPEFRNADALRGLEGFSHLWILWVFSENIRDTWSPTVRPPRLGGNKRLGVFATRSSFRPNPIAMSCVKIEEIRLNASAGGNGVRKNEGDSANGYAGPEIVVSGADLMDGTPIVDIKPYLPYADAIPDATGGFAEAVQFNHLDVDVAASELAKLPEEKREALKSILAEDPRPHYQADSERVYGFIFAGFEVKFRVNENRLSVVSIEKI